MTGARLPGLRLHDRLPSFSPRNKSPRTQGKQDEAEKQLYLASSQYLSPPTRHNPTPMESSSLLAPDIKSPLSGSSEMSHSGWPDYQSRYLGKSRGYSTLGAQAVGAQCD